MALPLPFFELTPAPSTTTSSSPNMATTYNQPAVQSNNIMPRFIELTPPPPQSNETTIATAHDFPRTTINEKALGFPIKFLELTPPIDAFKPLYSKHGLSHTTSTRESAAHGFVELTPPVIEKGGVVKEESADGGTLEGQGGRSTGESADSMAGTAETECSEDGKGGVGKMALQKRVDSAKGLRGWPC